MSQTFVIPDIHGRLDLLGPWPRRNCRPIEGGEDTIVTIGDYVDKGPASNGVIERLLAGVGDGFALVMLKGNHDAMMVDALRDASKMAGLVGERRRCSARFLWR